MLPRNSLYFNLETHKMAPTVQPVNQNNVIRDCSKICQTETCNNFVQKTKMIINSHDARKIIDFFSMNDNYQTVSDHYAALVLISSMGSKLPQWEEVMEHPIYTAIQENFPKCILPKNVLELEELTGEILSSLYKLIDNNKKEEFLNNCRCFRIMNPLRRYLPPPGEGMYSSASVCFSFGYNIKPFHLEISSYDVMKNDFMWRAIEKDEVKLISEDVKSCQDLIIECKKTSVVNRVFIEQINQRLKNLIKIYNQISTEITNTLKLIQQNIRLTPKTLPTNVYRQVSVVSTEGTDSQPLPSSTSSLEKTISILYNNIDNLSKDYEKLYNDLFNSSQRDFLLAQKGLAFHKNSLKEGIFLYKNFFSVSTEQNKQNLPEGLSELSDSLNEIFLQDLPASPSLPEQYNCTEGHGVALCSDSKTTSSNSNVHTSDISFTGTNGINVVDYLTKSREILNNFKKEINQFQLINQWHAIKKEIDDCDKLWDEINNQLTKPEILNNDYNIFCLYNECAIHNYLTSAKNILMDVNLLIKNLDKTFLSLPERTDTLTNTRNDLLLSVGKIKSRIKQILNSNNKSAKYWEKVDYDLTPKPLDLNYTTNLRDSINSYMTQQLKHQLPPVVKKK